MQAGKVSGVQSCDQSRSEQLFPSFLARNWLLVDYLLVLANHILTHFVLESTIVPGLGRGGSPLSPFDDDEYLISPFAYDT